MPSALTDTLKIERCYQHGRGHLSRTNDMSTLALGRLKYLINFYFLSSHV